MPVQQNAGVNDLTTRHAFMIRKIQSVLAQIIMDTAMRLTKQVNLCAPLSDTEVNRNATQRCIMYPNFYSDYQLKSSYE